MHEPEPSTFPERTQVGTISEAVIRTLSLNVPEGTPIYFGESNRRHMANTHPKDWEKYGERLERILANPDFVGLHPDGSIEYVVAFGVHIKVAVRVSTGGDYYARSLYHVDSGPAKRFIASGKWKRLVACQTDKDSV